MLFRPNNICYYVLFCCGYTVGQLNIVLKHSFKSNFLVYAQTFCVLKFSFNKFYSLQLVVLTSIFLGVCEFGSCSFLYVCLNVPSKHFGWKYVTAAFSANVRILLV